MSSDNCKNSKTSSMLTPELLSKDQQEAVTRLYEGNTLLVAKMGAGKTIIAATAITELLTDNELKRVLIVTTPKIAKTVWCQEFSKWQHTHHIKIASATGNPEERIDVFNSDAQVVVVTFNVLPWLKQNGLFDSFDGLLIDETTKLKTTGGAQFKAIRNQLKKFNWRSGLTGTPVSEDFESLFAQSMLIDCGESLGRNKQKFLEQYFFPTDYKQYNWQIKPKHESVLLDKVAHLIHVMPDYRGELKQPEYIPIKVTMPPSLAEYYQTMKNDMVVGDVVSQTAAVLAGKLQQIASGFVYLGDGTADRLSDYRVNALAELVDSLGDESVLIAYWFTEDLRALQDAIPDAVVFDNKRLSEQVQAWNAGKIKRLLIHPRSAGHGLQLEQGGRNIIWYTPYWSRDLWEQLNARLWRKGQNQTVKVYTIEAENTIDEMVTQRVEHKADFDTIFTQHLRGDHG